MIRRLNDPTVAVAIVPGVTANNPDDMTQPTNVTLTPDGNMEQWKSGLVNSRYIMTFNDYTPFDSDLGGTTVDMEEYKTSGGCWDCVYGTFNPDTQTWTTLTTVYIGYDEKDYGYKGIQIQTDGLSPGGVGGIIIPKGYEFKKILITLPENVDEMRLKFWINVCDIESVNLGTEVFGFTFIKGEYDPAAVWMQGMLRFQSMDSSPYVSFRSDATLPSPVKLTIYGPCVNPSWFHYVNGIKKCYGKLSITIDEGQWVEISTLDAQRSIMLYGDGSSGKDVFEKSDISTERFIHFEAGLNKVVVTSSSGYPQFKIEGMEYYVSV